MNSFKDPKWLLAFVSICGAFALQGYQYYLQDKNELPNWVVGLVSAVVSYYFGWKNGNGRKRDAPSDT